MKRITEKPWFSKKMPVTRQGWAVLICFFIVFYLSIFINFINITLGFTLMFLDIGILLTIVILTREDSQKRNKMRNRKRDGLILVAMGCLVLIVTFLFLLAEHTLYVFPLAVSFSIILVFWGTYEVREYNNMVLFKVFLIIIIAIGLILAYFDASMPIYEGDKPFSYIIIVFLTLGIILGVYDLFNRRYSF